MSKRRVVITGMGLVSPLGCGAESVCKRVFNGFSGVQKLQDGFLSPICAVDAIATVPSGRHEWNKECVEEVAFGKTKSVSKFIEFAQLATDLSLENGSISSVTEVFDPNKFGVAIGNGGIGSLSDIVESNANLTNSYKKLSPYFVPKVLVNMAAGQVSIKHGAKGPLHAVATACAAGAHSIGDAYNFIRLGYADAMLAGGTDASIDPLGLSGFARMKALGGVEADEDIQKASRPFHVKRNGFVMGEGAGILVLEELSVAKQRGARIYAEVCGYGLSGDASHATAPSADGDGAARSMRMAIQDANIHANQIGYINAHATSTPAGDIVEIEAIRRVFNSPTRSAPLFVSSTKGATGHLLGAAGAVESIFSVYALHSGLVPPTLNLDDVDPACAPCAGDVFQHVPGKSLIYKEASEGKHELNYVLKNSFAFGGMNASLIFGKYVE